MQTERCNEFLVLIDGEIKKDVEACQQNEKKQFKIKFRNTPKEYTYAHTRVQYLDKPTMVDSNSYDFTLIASNIKLFDIIKVLSFDDKFYKIYFSTKIGIYEGKDLKITKNALTDIQSKDLFDYFKKIASISYEYAQDADSKIIAKSLHSQYEKMHSLSPETVAATYLNPSQKSKQIENAEEIIFPFGCNLSQMSAVEKAVNNPISIIEGPPGTGKTQTILNIIANALINEKSVAVVSNNNSATDNVFEKLEKYKFSYLAAQLGKRENIENFFKNKQVEYPSFEDDLLNNDDIEILKTSISHLGQELSEIFIRQNRNAVLTSELADLKLEKKYFDEYFDGERYNNIDVFKNNKKITSTRTQMFLSEIKDYIETDKKINLWFKLKSFFYFGVRSFSVFNEDKASLIANIQKYFYMLKGSEISTEIKENNVILENFRLDDKLKNFTQNSVLLLRAMLAKRYNSAEKRTKFNENTRINTANFIKEYPIVLSSTHAIKNSLPNFIYDYLIVDEASQVGLSTAVLALSCAKRVVIVGDLKQLPNVIEPHLKKLYAECSTAYNISEKYSIENNSLLSSVAKVLPDIPKTLLKEHYRCHPKIIEFCNKRFYNNQLVIMSEDKGEKDVLKVIMTSAGNHARGNINHRQIDEIKHTILPSLNSNDVGIISPYRKQAAELKKVFPHIPSATVHKFQGRENDDIIITTVDNTISEFTDNPNLLNVAVSRAKNRLVVVISDNEKNENTNTGSLVSYIKYNSFEVVKSDLYSVFDMLYKANAQSRKEFLKKKKKISEYDSENIMYAILEEILEIDKFSHFGIGVHISLNSIIRNFDKIKDDTKKLNYAKNPATHVDFLIYNTVDKRPLLAIEVDGYSFHNETTKQSHRDKIKDDIFSLYDLPLERFSTTGSMEIERLIDVLSRVCTSPNKLYSS